MSRHMRGSLMAARLASPNSLMRADLARVFRMNAQRRVNAPGSNGSQSSQWLPPAARISSFNPTNDCWIPKSLLGFSSVGGDQIERRHDADSHHCSGEARGAAAMHAQDQNGRGRPSVPPFSCPQRPRSGREATDWAPGYRQLEGQESKLIASLPRSI